MPTLGHGPALSAPSVTASSVRRFGARPSLLHNPRERGKCRVRQHPLYQSHGGSRSRGTGDVILGTKVQLSNADEDGLGSIVELEARLPSGSAGSSSRKGEMDTLMATSVGKAMGQFSLIGTYELALLGEAGTDSIETEHGAIVAASWRANEETRLFAEASTSYSPSDGSSVWYGGFGGGYKFWPNLELQGALQIGLNDDAEDFFLVVGFSSVIGRFADATD